MIAIKLDCDSEVNMTRMGIFLLGLAVSSASPCLAAGFQIGVPTGACYVYSVDRALNYCRDNVIEKTCYEAARNFKMAGKWSKDGECIDVNYK
jgi:hypothetical protein